MMHVEKVEIRYLQPDKQERTNGAEMILIVYIDPDEAVVRFKIVGKTEDGKTLAQTLIKNMCEKGIKNVSAPLSINRLYPTSGQQFLDNVAGNCNKSDSAITAQVFYKSTQEIA
jgi:hypothetical protein